MIEKDPPEAPVQRPFLTRVWRAAMLDAAVYEEVEADRRAFRQAAVVVALSALGFGIGSFENGGWSGIFWTAVVMHLGWGAWALGAYWLGAGVLATSQTESDPGELLRTLGFASAPGILASLGFIPGLNPWLFGAVLLWMLATMVVAVRQALDYCSTSRAILVSVLTLPVALLPLAAVLLFTGPWPV
jgi:hypothetical protein